MNIELATTQRVLIMNLNNNLLNCNSKKSHRVTQTCFFYNVHLLSELLRIFIYLMDGHSFVSTVKVKYSQKTKQQSKRF